MEVRNSELHNQWKKYEMYAQDATSILVSELCKRLQIHESASHV